MPRFDGLTILDIALALLISITLHEASHVATAFWLGDDTGKRLGRLTLNPLAHLDPMGVIVLIISSIVGRGIGWGKPAPVNPMNLKRGFLASIPNGPLVGMGIVAIAGPISNLIMAVIGLQLLLLMPDSTATADVLVNGFLTWFVRINVTLAVFNMLPVPPLDGFRVVLAILPTAPGYTLARLEPYGFGVLILLVFAAPQYLQAYLQYFSEPVYRFIGAA